MKFKSWYRIEWGFFFKERFEGNLKQIQPSTIMTETSKMINNKLSYERIERNDQEYAMEVLSTIDKKEIVSYSFNIENGVLTEKIELSYARNLIRYYLKTSLNAIRQKLFLDNIFKYFGVYSCFFIKEHKLNHITSQDYILDELKEFLSKEPIEVTCGDYTIIYDRFSENDKEYLGIDAEYEGNFANQLDNRKGITLYVYRDDNSKKSHKDNNFVVNEETFKRFATISKGETRVISYLLKSLLQANVDFDLLYNFTTDYPEVELYEY